MSQLNIYVTVALVTLYKRDVIAIQTNNIAKYDRASNLK